MNPPRTKTKSRLNALSVANLMKCIQAEPMTLHELVEEVGLCLITTRSYILTLHKLQVCHIHHWEPDRLGRQMTPSFILGKGKDAAKAKKTASTLGKQYRARQAQLAMQDALCREAA